MRLLTGVRDGLVTIVVVTVSLLVAICGNLLMCCGLRWAGHPLSMCASLVIFFCSSKVFCVFALLEMYLFFLGILEYFLALPCF